MNFEIIDNAFQVTVLFIVVIADVVYGIARRNRLYIILALAHSSFMMGTLYFVLYLSIRGVVPQIFYVAEISWIASYLFLHSYQIVRYRGQKIRFSIIPLFCGIGVAAIAMWSGIFGPALLSTGTLALTAGAIVYISMFQLLYSDVVEKKNIKTNICFLMCIVLQLALYISSSFFHDYTKFNLYFALDITLTISLTFLLLCTLWEVKKDDVY